VIVRVADWLTRTPLLRLDRYHYVHYSRPLLLAIEEGLDLETRQILLNLLDFDQHFVLARSALRGRIQLEQQRIIRTEVCPSIGGRGRARESRKNLSRPTRGERR
jgi:hypothetical protein